jgi:hypothetical protein
MGESTGNANSFHGDEKTIGRVRELAFQPAAAKDRRVMIEGIALESVSLEPSPVIEAYKKDVDRTLIRENLKLTTEERVRKMISVLRFAESVRDSRMAPR